jgi:hypothetical protein
MCGELRGLLALVAIALIVGGGLCLFDPDEGQASGTDLCSSVVAIAALPLLPILTTSVIRRVPTRVTVCYVTSLEPTAPPPKA